MRSIIIKISALVFEQQTHNNQAEGMDMTYLRSMLLVIGLVSLVACNSDDSGIDEISISAELDQGSQWHEDIELGQFPSVLTEPEHGNISLSSGRVTYTPEPDFRGTDQARVEGRSAVYVFTFMVKPVNQPPQLINTSIEVIANREIEGQLEVYDQDGDEISFELLEVPERGEFTLEQSGYFHYQLDDLALPNATFTVAISDGVNDPVQETVTLLPAYRTNEEKAAYYYFSNHSHLLQAEQRLRQMNSDTDTEGAYMLLAEGYVLASLDDEVDRISNENIRSQEGRARNAYALSLLYQSRGETDKAAALRRKSFDLFTQMVVDNGIANMRSSDGSFYMTMQRGSRRVGDTELATQISEQLRVFIDELGGGEFNNALGHIAQILRSSAQEQMEEMQDTGSEVARETALENTDALAYLVEVGGYHVYSNRPTHFRLPPLYSDWVTELYYYLGEFEAAKRQLAYTLSYYGRADYDPDYEFPDKPFAEATYSEFRSPLISASAHFSVLYPDAETNVPLSMLEGREYDRAQDNIKRLSFVLRVLEGEDVHIVIEDLLAHFPDDARDQMRELTEMSSPNPRFGSTLRRFGYIEEADLALERAYNIMRSSVFTEQNAHSSRFLTGPTGGCYKIINLTLQTGDRELAQARARSCENLVSGATQDIFGNLINVMAVYLQVGLPDDSRSLYEQALQAMEAEKAEGLEQAQAYFALARLLAHGRQYQEAVAAAETGLAQLQRADVSETRFVNNALKSLEALTLTRRGAAVDMPANSMLIELRSHAYNEPDFQQWMLGLNEQIDTQLQRLQDEVLAFPTPEHEGMSEDLIEALSYARLYSDAEQVIRTLSLGEAERIQLRAQVSEIQAVQDDYPASAIATVDTDLDGRANFFAVSASTEQLSNTDIELDDDADGDGVKDEDDPKPLG